jgi:hypothetical protein
MKKLTPIAKIIREDVALILAPMRFALKTQSDKLVIKNKSTAAVKILHLWNCNQLTMGTGRDVPSIATILS